MTNFLNRFNSTSALRAGSACVLGSLLVPLAGCGSPAPPATTGSMPPSQQMSRPAMSAPNPNRPSLGLSGKQKVVLLAGAAALYYYYQKSKKATAAKYPGQAIQYYLSKNGGIYYRDPKNPRNAIFVTAPTKTVSIPANEAQVYSGVRGYNNQTTGNGLDYYFNGQGGAASNQ